MSKRSERREAERLSRKLAFTQRSQLPSQQPPASPATSATFTSATPADASDAGLSAASALRAGTESDLLAHAQAFFALNPESEIKKPISEAQLHANRANAQLSTGAITPEGKAKSARNALKHALTGKTVLLPNEDFADYQHQLEMQIETHSPATDEELALVQSIVDCRWRLDRVQRLESSVLLKGRIESAKAFPDLPLVERARLIEAEAYIKYEKQIRNLNIQEARLRRTLDKHRAELAAIQSRRRQQEQAERQQQQSERQAEQTVQRTAPVKNGFEFSPHVNQPIDQHANPERQSPVQAAATGNCH